jgi:hypothetical protein
MADFRMKLFVLAGMATAFAGMASAQTACNAASANAVFVRAESNDDQVADTIVTCSTAAGTAAGTVNLTVYLSPSVNIASFNVGTGSSPKSEAIAGVTGSFVVGGGAPFVSGSVSGNSVTFTGIAIPACGAGPCAVSLTITNIKVAASTVATTSGVPTGISETIFVSGTNTTPTAITTGSAVAYVTNGLSGIKTANTSSNALCNSTTTYSSSGVAKTANWTIAFAEAFPNAFRIAGTAAGNAALGSWYNNHTETGTGVTAYTTANTATSGTRIKIIFNNIPANVSVYMPTSVAGTNSGVVTMTATETGAFSPVTGSTATGAPGATGSSSSSVTVGDGSSALLTVTSGSATVIYEVTAVSTAPSTFTVPVYLSASSGAVTAPTTPITQTVSFAPIGASSNVPNFVVGSSTPSPVSGSTFAACSTTLLFPFVTNQFGFESGLAISNTGADLLNPNNGSPKSSVTGQSGTCTLTFFGNATASSNPGAFTTASVPTGTSWTNTLTQVVGGTPGNFGGYMIASCNFLYAHGFTYITYNIGQSSGMALGYLALVVNTPRTNSSAISVTVPAVVGGAAPAGGSSFVGVSSGTPEQLGN